MKLDTAKILAVAGLILSMLSFIHATLGLVGLVLYLAGMYHIGQHYNKREVFRYALVSTVGFTAALIAIALLVGLGALLGTLAAGPMGVGASIAAGLALAYIAILLMGKYKRDLMRTLAPHSSSIAEWAARLYWYGAILAILLVGLALLLIAQVLEAIVLATLRPTRTPAGSSGTL
ncbi:hypothetical protein Pyrde_1912 [Pyrodictium delaneyi]|uniref:DUF996 domain-containing protein n=1 Tax=Pyrodictium delaneyi TaxID=1273541 RepID=A0A0P0N561_9CREN|nr:DUF996 domain-containing protein [Pyrodictium delaneyi]ALL01955.1 hypothetical protein Pyrde_1912 [Pyrodictium delaneyi]